MCARLLCDPSRDGARTTLGRTGEAVDIADVVAFLISPQGGWIAPQLIQASGGHAPSISHDNKNPRCLLHIGHYDISQMHHDSSKE